MKNRCGLGCSGFFAEKSSLRNIRRSLEHSMTMGGEAKLVMAYVLTAMAVLSVIYGCLSGNGGALTPALLEGAGEAAQLCISLCGAICFFSGLMEVMRRAGLTRALSGVLAPLLRRIFPESFRDGECAGAIAENFTANLLGLGNAATPAGICAVRRMALCQGENSRELIRLVVMNTASLQLLPTTVASLRAALGAENALDILPCVWISSVLSVSAGLLAAKVAENSS